jgi:hypothetical protein
MENGDLYRMDLGVGWWPEMTCNDRPIVLDLDDGRSTLLGSSSAVNQQNNSGGCFLWTSSGLATLGTA